MPSLPFDSDLTRRDVLKAGGGALAAAAIGPQLVAAPAQAQTPRRGGVLRLCNLLDAVGFDPHQTTSFATMIPLSFTHSRLLRVKAGPSVKPGTYPLELDLAESWSRENDLTYVFKLKKGVRWHARPPLDGRELTAEDVRYTYDRFLNTKNNGNRPTLDAVEKVEAPDRYTVRFTLKEPYVWLPEALASTSTWIVAREAVEKFGDLKRPESVIGTGPWMLDRWEPNVRMTFSRNPSYFVSGLPYADGVELTIDRDPSSRLAGWLAGKYDFAPEFQQVVRRLDLAVARQRKPGLQTVEYPWLVNGILGFRLAEEPFKDIRVRRALARATSLAEIFESNAFSQGQYAAHAVVPAGFTEWTIPIDQLGPEGRKNFEFSVAEARRLLAEAGLGSGFKTTLETTAGYGPDYMDYIQILVKNWKAAGIDVDLKLKEYGAHVTTTIFGKFDKMMAGLGPAYVEPDSYISRAYMPGSPINVMGVNDPRLNELVYLQRRTPDPRKRRDVIWDAQRYISEAGYSGVNGAARVVTAWDSHVRNFGANNGNDYGGRLMAVWLDK